MEVKIYYVSAERGQRVDRLWFRTEEEALYIEPSDAFKEREEDGDDI